MMCLPSARGWFWISYLVGIGIILIVLLAPLRGLDLIVCRASPGDTSGQHWSWYMIDSRKCWFEGRPKSKPRDSLYWPEEIPATALPIFAEPPELKPVAPEWEVEYRWPQGVR